MRNVQGETISNNKFPNNTRILIGGSTGSGKTTFVFHLIKNQHFINPIQTVHYFSTSANPIDIDWHDTLPNVDVFYYEGLPSLSFYPTVKPNSIVIIDDLFEDAIESSDVSRAFRVESRHRDFALIIITQVLI